MTISGLRAGEIGGLKWEDIDFENKELHVNRTLLQDKSKGGFYYGTPKTATSKRTVPLTDEAVSVLRDQQRRQFKLRAKHGICNGKDLYLQLSMVIQWDMLHSEN